MAQVTREQIEEVDRLARIVGYPEFAREMATSRACQISYDVIGDNRPWHVSVLTDRDGAARLIEALRKEIAKS